MFRRLVQALFPTINVTVVTKSNHNRFLVVDETYTVAHGNRLGVLKAPKTFASVGDSRLVQDSSIVWL